MIKTTTTSAQECLSTTEESVLILTLGVALLASILLQASINEGSPLHQLGTNTTITNTAASGQMV